MNTDTGRVVLELGELKYEVKAAAARRRMSMKDWFFAAARNQLTLESGRAEVLEVESQQRTD